MNESHIQHLREFLSYLEERNMINIRTLEDKDQLRELVQEIMKRQVFNS